MAVLFVHFCPIDYYSSMNYKPLSSTMAFLHAKTRPFCSQSWLAVLLSLHSSRRRASSLHATRRESDENHILAALLTPLLFQTLKEEREANSSTTATITKTTEFIIHHNSSDCLGKRIIIHAQDHFMECKWIEISLFNLRQS